MWQFKECVRGIAEACQAFGTPVTGGNVSLYNETLGEAIWPTPVILFWRCRLRIMAKSA